MRFTAFSRGRPGPARLPLLPRDPHGWLPGPGRIREGEPGPGEGRGGGSRSSYEQHGHSPR